MPLVGIAIGSKTDADLIQPALEILKQFDIEYEVRVLSAHRNAEAVREYSLKAKERGIEVIIAGAGGAAHLPGVISSWTTLPVIGIPLPTSELRGVDALLSIVQMPGGVPVACMPIGMSGAKNAALLAAQILSLKYERIKEAYEKYKRNLSQT